jgi:hypothetical protein
MKTKLLVAVFLAMSAGGANVARSQDERSDAELLDLARNRSQLERVTADPVMLSQWMATACRAPTPAIIDAERKNPHSQQSAHVYADSNSVEPLWTLFGTFSQDSILLKEKIDERDPDKPLLFTGMIKREPGYYPEGGDWEYFTLDGELTKVTSRGKLESCAACHRDFAAWDHVSKQYTAVPVSQRQYHDYLGRVESAIVAGSSGVVYLPASLAETHGAKLSRAAAESRWRKQNADSGEIHVPEDLHDLGGPALRYEEVKEKDTLGYWTRADDWASWEIDVRKPGTFQVFILQGCGNGSGGSEVSVSVADQSLSFVVEETGGFQNFKWREIGSIEIAAPGKHTLIVKPLKKPGLAVMDLRMVKLQLK